MNQYDNLSTLNTEIAFDYPEDQQYFEASVFGRLLSEQDIETYFDFSDPHKKRQEFNKIRGKVLSILLEQFGTKCLLNMENICDLNSGLQVDHLIPLSSNLLNKHLRKLTRQKPQKVATQSFGSNNLSNLVLACAKCNGKKKNSMPSLALFQLIEVAKKPTKSNNLPT